LEPGNTERLVTEARRGDSEALTGLCSAFYPRILKYMRYRTDAATAQDLTAEVFVRVVRNMSKQHGSFRAWIYRIARNVAIDASRRRKARREEQMSDETLSTIPTQGDPAVTVARQEELQGALAQLTDEQRELVTLKFIQGLSNEEVGEVTGRRPGAVRALQFRALSALRDILGKGSDHG
jgi:RNA polymerase sigma-70 factor (ECF subfamily)